MWVLPRGLGMGLGMGLSMGSMGRFQHEGLLKLPRGCGSNETAAKATASCAVCCVNVVRL